MFVHRVVTLWLDAHRCLFQKSQNFCNNVAKFLPILPIVPMCSLQVGISNYERKREICSFAKIRHCLPNLLWVAYFGNLRASPSIPMYMSICMARKKKGHNLLHLRHFMCDVRQRVTNMNLNYNYGSLWAWTDFKFFFLK